MGKAVSRAKRSLPKISRKRKAIVRKLVDTFSAGLVTQTPETHCQRSSAIPDETKELVKNFYTSDSVSTQAPGIRDFCIVRENNEKHKIQKRYLHLTLGEAHQTFLKEYPSEKIGLTKFTELRPQHVCLRSETPDNLCLCIYHENLRLILQSMSFLPNSGTELIKKIVCSDENKTCMLQECNECGDLKLFKEMVESIPPETLGKEVYYKQWSKSEDNRIFKNSKHEIVNEALYVLESQLVYFLWHVYIKRTQTTYFDNLQKNLPLETLLMQIDFSENYTHTYQDEIQSAHWENKSFTLYTAMIYYCHNEETSQKVIKAEPYVIVSDYLHHDKYAVITFNKMIVESFKRKYPDFAIKNIEFQSDGTSQHFKQKFTLYHMTQSSIPTKWNFSATSHGKGGIDGIGGTVKRRIRDAVKARKIDPTTSLSFATEATKICPNINILHAASEDIENRKKMLDDTWETANGEIHSIPGTRQLHSFQSFQPGIIRCSMTSSGHEIKEFNFHTGILKDVCNKNNSVQPVATTSSVGIANIGQWVQVVYKGEKFHGIILDSCSGQHLIKCLIPTSTQGQFKFENENDAVWYSTDKIVQNIDIVPTLLNSRSYYKL